MLCSYLVCVVASLLVISFWLLLVVFVVIVVVVVCLHLFRERGSGLRRKRKVSKMAFSSFRSEPATNDLKK